MLVLRKAAPEKLLLLSIQVMGFSSLSIFFTLSCSFVGFIL